MTIIIIRRCIRGNQINAGDKISFQVWMIEINPRVYDCDCYIWVLAYRFPRLWRANLVQVKLLGQLRVIR